MCGPGEVDDDLEPETAEECAKYGKVVSCMIFELPDSPDDEAVRIFVEFESDDAATKGEALSFCFIPIRTSENLASIGHWTASLIHPRHADDLTFLEIFSVSRS